MISEIVQQNFVCERDNFVQLCGMCKIMWAHNCIIPLFLDYIMFLLEVK